MIRTRDLYTYVAYPALAPAGGASFGSATIQYEVRRYEDLRNLASGNSAQAFIVTCTQRVIVPNGDPYSLKAGVAVFHNYPALISSSIALTAPGPVQLIDYSPKTLNSSVQTDQAESAGASMTSTHQSTTGSSTATTNSYGASASVGAMGDVPTASVSGSYEHGSTKTTYSDDTTGTAASTDNQLSNSSEMTIKNWGSYAQLDRTCSSPTWIWGQEYPWNVIQFKNTAPGSNNIVLPPYVQQRLAGGGQPFPPSELALFGVNFVSKAAWLLTPAPTAGPLYLASQCNVTCINASHGLDENGNVVANFVQSSTAQYVLPPTAVDLELYALDPLPKDIPAGSAVVGFVPNKFTVAPAAGASFKITSDSNNIHVRGQGFQDVMSTDFPAGTATSLTVYFKMIDRDSDISLYLKHWKTADRACVLTISINGNAGVITKHVDATEEEGGADNFTRIALRYKDFASIDYCDYLVLGLNTIAISVAPSQDGDTAAAAGYALSALAIG